MTTGYTVLDIAQALHMGVIGTAAPPTNHPMVATWLRNKLADWEPSASPYDAAVLLLCSEALREYDYWAENKSDTWL